MYKLHLIRKYLLKRRIAWVALVAVMLCTAMVLIVVSVMSGWLRNFEDSFHGMTGDVVISGTSLGGFPYYQEMIDGIKKLPDAQAAVPMIRTFGLLNSSRSVYVVQVMGYPPDIGLVNDWPASLHLKNDERKKQLEMTGKRPGITDAEKNWIGDQEKNLPFALHSDVAYENYLDRRAKANALQRAPIIVSTALADIPRGNEDLAADRRFSLYRSPVSLTLVPVAAGEAISADTVRSVPAWIVDDSKSQVWQLDKDAVYLSFEEAQRDLLMAGSAAKPANGTEPAMDASPARCTEVEIKAKPGVDLNVLRDEVLKVTEVVRAKHPDDWGYDYSVQTWVEQQGAFIKAVQNEVVLTTVLFAIISMVAVLLILCIFYMIVAEKTKDIGIIKSVGATGTGIMGLFLGYGLAIGVVGASLGFTFAFFFVKYINEIHGWLGRITGHPIWTQETYQLDKIPNEMQPKVVVYTVLFAILSAVIGALIPALRAAVMNPVDALRYE